MTKLRAAGYRPGDVDEVYITHLGPDHVGGLTAPDGSRVFPNAVVRVPQREVDRFQKPDAPQAKAFGRFWSELFTPYSDAGSLTTFDADTTLVRGIRTLATHGHSEGHTSYVVESKGEVMIIMGDLVLVDAAAAPNAREHVRHRPTGGRRATSSSPRSRQRTGVLVGRRAPGVSWYRPGKGRRRRLSLDSAWGLGGEGAEAARSPAPGIRDGRTCREPSD